MLSSPYPIAQPLDICRTLLHTRIMTGQINMLDHNSLLRSQFDLNEIIDTGHSQPDNPPLSHSPYYDHDALIEHLKRQTGSLKILSLNVQSLNAKIDEIKILMNELATHNIQLDLLYLQETWLGNSQLPPFTNLNGYNIVHQPKHASEHGGLIFYVRERISFSIIPLPQCKSWESQFIKVSVEGHSIILGNVYRPPHKSIIDMENFNVEFNATLNKLPNSQSVVISGDFNINLLSLACPSSPQITEFFNNVISFGLIPKITLPTRLSDTSCTLIDNFFCKLDLRRKVTSGVLTHKVSDHQPYFITIPLKGDFQVPNEYFKLRTITQETIEKVGHSILNVCSLDLSSDPNLSYNALSSALTQSLNEHLPIKLV
jgi:hypothetical protein